MDGAGDASDGPVSSNVTELVSRVYAKCKMGENDITNANGHRWPPFQGFWLLVVPMSWMVVIVMTMEMGINLVSWG